MTEPETRREEARRLYLKERMTEREVAAAMGLSKTRVNTLLNETRTRRRPAAPRKRRQRRRQTA